MRVDRGNAATEQAPRTNQAHHFLVRNRRGIAETQIVRQRRAASPWITDQQLRVDKLASEHAFVRKKPIHGRAIAARGRPRSRSLLF
jgi:hypothetical protein